MVYATSALHCAANLLCVGHGIVSLQHLSKNESAIAVRVLHEITL